MLCLHVRQLFILLYMLMMPFPNLNACPFLDTNAAIIEEKENRLSAKTKRDNIWKKILASEYPSTGLPPLEGPPLWSTISSLVLPSWLSLPGLYHPSFVAKAFTHKGDIMLAGRRKHIHRNGVSVKVAFVSLGVHHYTGIFQGAPYGIARFSLAKKPSSRA